MEILSFDDMMMSKASSTVITSLGLSASDEPHQSLPRQMRCKDLREETIYISGRGFKLAAQSSPEDYSVVRPDFGAY